MVMSPKSRQAETMMGVFSKATDLKKRILFTLLALIVFRFGSFIPLPGVNPEVFAEYFRQNSSGLLGMFDTFAGGALSRMTILALNIMPYISASIVIQLGSSVIPSLITLKKEGASGYRKLNQYTRYLTILICILQGYALAVAVEKMGENAVILESSFLFRLSTVVSLLGGTFFVVWLGEQITNRGVGNGTSLIITTGILAGIPSAIGQTLELGRVGQISLPKILFVLLMAVMLVYIVVLVERAQRRIMVQYPKRSQRMMMTSNPTSYVPLKINSTGVMPPIFASALMVLIFSLIKFLSGDSGSEAGILFSRGTGLYLTVYAAMIILFTFFYTGISFDPKDVAERLKQQGGFIAGIRPGEATARYLDYVSTRLTLIGAIYLAVLCVLPELFISQLNLPFYLGGTTLLIAVTVVMDTMSQIQSHLVSYQYDSLIRKAKLKGRI